MMEQQIPFQIIMNYNLIQEIASGCISISEAVDFIGRLATNTVCMLKISVIRLNKRKMYSILASAVNDWSVIRDKQSRKIMLKHAYRGRVVCMFQVSVAYFIAGFIILVGLPTFGGTTQSRNLPMGTGCFVVNTPYFLYLGLYILQFAQLLCMCSCNFGTDSLFFGIAMHLCAQFKLLQNDIAKLKIDAGSERKSKQHFVTLIQRHNHLICLLNFVEDVFHLIILGQLAASGLHITLLGMCRESSIHCD